MSAAAASAERITCAYAEAFGDVAARVLADGQVGQPVGRGDAAVEGAGAFGGLGRVLGHVASDLSVGQPPVGGNGPDVAFAAPRQRAGCKTRSGRGSLHRQHERLGRWRR